MLGCSSRRSGRGGGCATLISSTSWIGGAGRIGVGVGDSVAIIFTRNYTTNVLQQQQQKGQYQLQYQQQQCRRKSTNNSNDNYSASSNNNSDIIYEGPLGTMITPLKIMSVSTAVLSVIGLPIAIGLKAMDPTTLTVPLSSQIALGSITIITSMGSTLALHGIFSPYIYSLQKVVVPTAMEHGQQQHEGNNDEKQQQQQQQQHASSSFSSSFLLKATTRNLFAFQQETMFDPMIDVVPYSGFRPFCNFVAKGVPLYIHPELIHDETLLRLLLPDQQPSALVESSTGDYDKQKKKKKEEDDDSIF